MKVNRFVALALVAFMAIGAMGLVSTQSFAKTTSGPVQQVQVTAAPSNPAGTSGVEDTSSGPDADNLQEQSGVQTEDGQAGAVESPGTDPGPDQQSPSYTSSIPVDQATSSGMSEADEASALAGQARISLDQAKAAALAANPGATVVKAGLDNENGALVYSVELNNGSDVKVDAGSGAVLNTQAGGDNEG